QHGKLAERQHPALVSAPSRYAGSTSRPRLRERRAAPSGDSRPHLLHSVPWPFPAQLRAARRQKWAASAWCPPTAPAKTYGWTIPANFPARTTRIRKRRSGSGAEKKPLAPHPRGHWPPPLHVRLRRYRDDAPAAKT